MTSYRWRGLKISRTFRNDAKDIFPVHLWHSRLPAYLSISIAHSYLSFSVLNIFLFFLLFHLLLFLFVSYFLMPQLGGKPGCFFFLGGHEESLQGLSALPSSASASIASPPSPPSSGSQDQPGAFATKEANDARRAALRTNCICHGTAYDFNDNALPPAVLMWVRLVEARLGVSLYDTEELGPELVAAAVEKAAAAIVGDGAAGAAAAGSKDGKSEKEGAAKKRKFKV